VFLSDIHLDINIARKDQKFMEKLIQYLSSITADILIFTGDIAGKTQQVIEFFEATSSLPFERKLYVPGNHDIWVHQDAQDLSKVKYYDILPEIANRYGWDFIPNNPLILDDIAFVGTMGWYDYSSRNKIWDSKLSLHDYSRKIHPQLNVELMDRHFVRFGMDDQSISDVMIGDLARDIHFVEDRVPIEELDTMFVLTHMVPFEQFVHYRGILRFDYFTAYFGNYTLGDEITRISKRVKVESVFGQVHHPMTKQLSVDLQAHCVPIGYPREYGKQISLDKLFSTRIKEYSI
jgi:hypothetical protein